MGLPPDILNAFTQFLGERPIIGEGGLFPGLVGQGGQWYPDVTNQDYLSALQDPGNFLSMVSQGDLALQQIGGGYAPRLVNDLIQLQNSAQTPFNTTPGGQTLLGQFFDPTSFNYPFQAGQTPAIGGFPTNPPGGGGGVDPTGGGGPPLGPPPGNPNLPPDTTGGGGTVSPAGDTYGTVYREEPWRYYNPGFDPNNPTPWPATSPWPQNPNAIPSPFPHAPYQPPFQYPGVFGMETDPFAGGNFLPFQIPATQPLNPEAPSATERQQWNLNAPMLQDMIFEFMSNTLAAQPFSLQPAQGLRQGLENFFTGSVPGAQDLGFLTGGFLGAPGIGTGGQQQVNQALSSLFGQGTQSPFMDPFMGGLGQAGGGVGDVTSQFRNLVSGGFPGQGQLGGTIEDALWLSSQLATPGMQQIQQQMGGGFADPFLGAMGGLPSQIQQQFQQAGGLGQQAAGTLGNMFQSGIPNESGVAGTTGNLLNQINMLFGQSPDLTQLPETNPLRFLGSIFAAGPPGQQGDISGRGGIEGLQGFLTNQARDLLGQAGSPNLNVPLGQETIDLARQNLLGGGNVPSPGIQGTVGDALSGLIQGGGLSPEFVQAQTERVLEPAQDQLIGRLNRLAGGAANLGASGAAQDPLQELSGNFMNDLVRQGFSNLLGATGQGAGLGQQIFGQGLANQQLGQQNVSQLANLANQQQQTALQLAGLQGQLGLGAAGQAPDIFSRVMQNALAPVQTATDFTRGLGGLALGGFQAVPQTQFQGLGLAGNLGNQLFGQGLQGLQSGLGAQQQLFGQGLQGLGAGQNLQQQALQTAYGLNQANVGNLGSALGAFLQPSQLGLQGQFGLGNQLLNTIGQAGQGQRFGAQMAQAQIPLAQQFLQNERQFGLGLNDIVGSILRANLAGETQRSLAGQAGQAATGDIISNIVGAIAGLI